MSVAPLQRLPLLRQLSRPRSQLSGFAAARGRPLLQLAPHGRRPRLRELLLGLAQLPRSRVPLPLYTPNQHDPSLPHFVHPAWQEKLLWRQQFDLSQAS